MLRTLSKRTLVTGGTGFLGVPLCRHLFELGDEVICVDNFYIGTPGNTLAMLEHPDFEIIPHDITFPSYLGVDEIYNLSCPASPTHYHHDPVQTTKSCLPRAINMLGMARCTGARIPHASTSEIYDDPQVDPQTESCRGHVNPISQCNPDIDLDTGRHEIQANRVCT